MQVRSFLLFSLFFFFKKKASVIGKINLCFSVTEPESFSHVVIALCKTFSHPYTDLYGIFRELQTVPVGMHISEVNQRQYKEIGSPLHIGRGPEVSQKTNVKVEPQS